MTCHVFHPNGPGKWPAIIFYMDGVAIRPDLLPMADRLAKAGYVVLLPDLFYRSGPYKEFVPAEVFAGGPERERLMSMITAINNNLIMSDTSALLEFLDQRDFVSGKKIGCVGYCMGGAFALSAAGTYPDRVAAAASFHGGRLATEKPDSPHLLAPHMRGQIYVGIAGIDPHFTPEEKQRLESALQSAGVSHEVEVYENVKHGFAVNDTPVYDRAASERHWTKLLGLFEKALRG